jgi:manganese oxidase
VPGVDGAVTVACLLAELSGRPLSVDDAIRIGNLSMHEHPVHLHGVQFQVTGGDGGWLPEDRWRTEVTELVGVGQMRDIEFVPIPGDWPFHCHKSHHTMNAMGETGMAEHQKHTDMGHMKGPANTLPMMMGKGAFGNLEMGGMFTVLKVRDDLAAGDYRDPGPYRNPAGTVAHRVSNNPNFGNPVRRNVS